MKPIVRMLIEAGIIDKDTVLAMEKWGNLEPGTADLVGTKKPVTRRDKEAFAEQVSELLDTDLETPPKETRLEVHASKPFTVKGERGFFTAVWDEMGRLICDQAVDVKVDDYLDIPEKGFSRVESIEKLYQGEELFALQLTVVKA